jgi:hypothetical protein
MYKKTEELKKPYEEVDNIRTFKASVDDTELVWHRDREKRTITVLEGNNWQLQLDDELPITMGVGDSFIINEMTYHRIIKGDGDLKVKIYKWS